jgi:hypothetical protein
MIKILLAVVLIIALLVLGPFAVLWSLNTLFPVLALTYTLENWCAIIVLGAFISPNVTIKRKNG